MADLTEANTYEPGIYQLETTDPVLAGPGGISNLQAQQLANRTNWLAAEVDILKGGGTTGWGIVASSPLTSLTNWTPQGGTWIANPTYVEHSAGAVARELLRREYLLQPASGYLADVELYIPAGQSGDLYAGLEFAAPATNVPGGLLVRLDRIGGTQRWTIERAAQATLATGNLAWTYDTWQKLRAVYTGGIIYAYLDGVLLGSATGAPGSGVVLTHSKLYAAATTARFRAWALQAFGSFPPA